MNYELILRIIKSFRFLNSIILNVGLEAHFSAVFIEYRKYDLNYVKMKLRFEKSRRVYNRVLKPETNILEFSFFFFLFTFLSTFSLPDLFFPFPFFLRRGHLRLDPPSFVVLPARRPTGASHLVWRSSDRREGEPDRATRARTSPGSRCARSPGRRAPGHADWSPTGH